MHLFRRAPPRPQIDGSASSFWTYTPDSGPGTPDLGYYTLAKVEKGVTLNFILKTSLDLKEQTVAGAQNPLTLATNPSPVKETRFDSASYDETQDIASSRVLILYRFNFVL